MPRTKTPTKRKATRKPPQAKDQSAPLVALGGDWGAPLVNWGSTSTAGVRVNEYTVLKIATVLACIRYIATTIATTDYNVYELLDNGGKKYRPDDPVDWILDKQANPETPAIVFWETMLLWCLLWGNAYAEITRDGYGRVAWLWQIAPDRVTLERDGQGQQYYEVTNYTAETSRIRPENMFHLRGLSWDGQLGYNIARLCKEVFGGPLAAQEFANAFFGNDATPGFVLSTEQALSNVARDRLLSSHSSHRGARNAHKFDVFEEGVKPVRLGSNAEETQLVEVGYYHVEQVARVFGVPLTKIGHMLHSGNRANMEEDDRAAYKQCLRPWARKIECEADVKLFGRINRGKHFTLHDFSVLLKGNSEQMTNQACQLLDRGVLNVNEARDWFDYNPLSEEEGGNIRPYPRNFTILEKAGEDPKPPSGGGASGDAPGAGRSNKPPGTARAAIEPVQDGVLSAQVQATFGGLLADVYGRLLRVEADKARRAENKEHVGTHIVGYYNADSDRNVAEAIRPVLEAALLALGRSADGADGLAQQFAEDHNGRSIRELAEGTWLKAWTNGRASEQAQEHLHKLWESLPTATLPAAPAPPQPSSSFVINVAAPLSPDVRVENVVHVPEQRPPDVQVQNTFQMPETKPPDVQVQNHIDVPRPGRKTAKKRPDGSWDIREE